MTIYCDFSYYSNTYHGKMSEADFVRYAGPASAYLDRITFGRITGETCEDEIVGDLIRRACCAVAENMLHDSQSAEGAIAMETVGSHSVSYRDRSKAEKDMGLYSSAALYLADVSFNGVKLMYRGI